MFYSANGDYVIKNILEGYNGNDYNKFKILFGKLMDDWSVIFPDRNRNVGGPQFFKYIIDLNPSKDDFEILNKFYCGVSGSIVSPERIFKKDDSNFTIKNDANDFVTVRKINGGYKCGLYYRCCWPCSCDIMNENLDVRVEDIKLSLNDGSYTYSLLTIPDPCTNSIMVNDNEVINEVIPDPDSENEQWNEVTAYKCENKLTKNAFKTESGRIVFAVLFNSSDCTIEEYKNHEYFNNELYSKCIDRKDSKNNLQNWGMGDIFVKLTKFN